MSSIAEAKKISIVSYLSSIDIFPVKEKQTEAWYLSPLHEEATPSFKVDLQKNLWYDHGIGEGGTIIDICIKLQKCSVTEACKILTGETNNLVSFSPAPLQNSKKEDEVCFEIKKVADLQNKALIEYLSYRKINIDIAKMYLKEIYFKKVGTAGNLFALAFENDIGGYETRNSLFKGNIGGKSITTIPGKSGQNVAIFEGFMDFLSILTHYKADAVQDDVIIMNSLSLQQQTIDAAKEYAGVKYFLDNDVAGKKALADMVGQTGGKNGSVLYDGYKDANDWLQGMK